jgi:DNA repair protein RadA/Sms
MTIGIDANRVALLLAVLERKNGGSFVTHDVYVNLAGGLQIDEPAIDLGIVAAILSSQRNTPIAFDVAIFGEVGLLGEVRSVSQPDLRAREATALGFRRLIVPRSNATEIHADIEVIPVGRIEEFADVLFAKA